MGNHQPPQPSRASAPTTVPTNVINDIFRQNNCIVIRMSY